ncbi:MAG TPA: gamma carbonic anhydrase family protein [Stellaceae bacterium]|nr:gamma carbonic anhydrase family protein [Stellaceae bacterium]
MSIIRAYGGFTPKVHPTAWVAENAALIGDVELGENVGIWYGVVLRGDSGGIRIGRNSNVQDNSVMHEGVEVGADITIGHMALVHACKLEDNCFIGMKATVMDEVVVEEGAMVAAGALVTPGKRIPKGQLWAGAPARFMRELRDADYATMRQSAAYYVELAKKYRG